MWHMSVEITISKKSEQAFWRWPSSCLVQQPITNTCSIQDQHVKECFTFVCLVKRCTPTQKKVFTPRMEVPHPETLASWQAWLRILLVDVGAPAGPCPWPCPVKWLLCGCQLHLPGARAVAVQFTPNSTLSSLHRSMRIWTHLHSTSTVHKRRSRRQIQDCQIE